jgi:hypothetical protein
VRNRTRSMLALGITVMFVAVGSLAGVPTANACPIDPEGNCIVTWHATRIPDPPTKQKHAKKTKAPIRHSR